MECYESPFLKKLLYQIKRIREVKWETKELQTLKDQLGALLIISKITKNRNFYAKYEELKIKYYQEENKAKRKSNENYLQKQDNKILAAWNLVKQESEKTKTKTCRTNNLLAHDLNNSRHSSSLGLLFLRFLVVKFSYERNGKEINIGN